MTIRNIVLALLDELKSWLDVNHRVMLASSVDSRDDPSHLRFIDGA